jgi:chlorobactene glucosyltransferase
MIAALLHFLLIVLTFFTFYTVLATLFNAFAMKRVPKGIFHGTAPLVSILVPARNEEGNIITCVESLLSQDYPNFEVVVYDDCSTDGTLEKLHAISDRRLKLVEGTSVPHGWTGKNWACFNLANSARGDYLLFVDADTWASPAMLSSVMRFVKENNIRASSGIPHEKIDSLWEALTIPFMFWGMFSLFPYFLSNITKLPGGASLAIGQFMIFQREFYFHIGGHRAVKSRITDDAAMASLVRRNGEPFFLFRLGDLFHCKMYRTFGDALSGFSRSYGSVFNYQPLPTFLAFLWLSFYAVAPFALIAAHFYWGLSLIGCNVFVWTMISAFFRTPWIDIVLNPVLHVLSGFFIFYSSFLARSGTLQWKERPAVATFRDDER